MIFIYILLVVAGALPLISFLIGRKNYRFILANGIETTAEVTHVRTNRYHKGPTYDQVYFSYLPAGSITYKSGVYKFKTGTYRSGDRFNIFYLPQYPHKHAIPGSKGELPVMIFMVLFFLFIIYACFKINEMVGDSNITFRL
jgi:hypothetical protein